MELKFDDDALRRLAKQVTEAKAEELQAMVDGVVAANAGQPVEEVKVALQTAWEQTGGTISDPELTQWATAISQGRLIVIQPGEPL